MNDNANPTTWIRPVDHEAVAPVVAPLASQPAADYGTLNNLCDLLMDGKTTDLEFSKLNDLIYGALISKYPPNEDVANAA